ncbi:MAG: hypothetical protein IPM79_30335 [Polyangiaceae bacterium]|nr:hypothetical protein [Polyangiaceae bacterium]MBK8941785.1 hypothetical protein [Polyangiaceae bacterium]
MTHSAHAAALCSRRSSSSPSSPARSNKALHCPFVSGLHAEVDAIQAHVVAWAVALGLVDGERAAHRLDASKVGWLLARANPEAPRSFVELAADWTTFFCLLDDRIEQFPTPDSVASYLDEVLRALTGGPADPGDSIQHAARDLHRRFQLVAERRWMARFARKNRELFEAFKVEAHARASGGMGDVRSYLPLREVTVGIWVELEISELGAGIELCPEERAETIDMARMACNLVGWANDIFTYEKELAAGDPNNLVLLLARSDGGDLDAALQRAVRMHDREANSLALRIGEASGVGSEAVRRFASVLGHWVKGHLDWAHETGRYAG